MLQVVRIKWRQLTKSRVCYLAGQLLTPLHVCPVLFLLPAFAQAVPFPVLFSLQSALPIALLQLNLEPQSGSNQKTGIPNSAYHWNTEDPRNSLLDVLCGRQASRIANCPREGEGAGDRPTEQGRHMHTCIHPSMLQMLSSSSATPGQAIVSLLVTEG